MNENRPSVALWFECTEDRILVFQGMPSANLELVSEFPRKPFREGGQNIVSHPYQRTESQQFSCPGKKQTRPVLTKICDLVLWGQSWGAPVSVGWYTT